MPNKFTYKSTFCSFMVNSYSARFMYNVPVQGVGVVLWRIYEV